MSQWYHKNKEITKIEDFPSNCVGFIYKITNTINGKIYIGKKILNNTTTVKLGKKAKKALAETITGQGRRPSKTKVVKESNWITYYGSSKELLEDVKSEGEAKFTRDIIEFAYSKKQLSYFELKHQILHKVLEYPATTYNKTILGKFYPSDLV